MEYAIAIEVEADVEVMADVIATLETILPYMADNVLVRSYRKDTLETDNDGTRLLYFN